MTNSARDDIEVTVPAERVRFTQTNGVEYAVVLIPRERILQLAEEMWGMAK